VKNAYLTRLGIPVAWSSGLFLAAYAAVRVGASFGFESRHGVVPSEVLANVALLLAGCAGGVWLSFGARKTTLTSDELAVPEADRLHPMVRVISATLLTLVLALLFEARVLEIKVGGLASTTVLSAPLSALLIGLLCGFAEQALPAKLTAQTTRFFEKA
jgi:uncharacterized membrane protein